MELFVFRFLRNVLVMCFGKFRIDKCVSIRILISTTIAAAIIENRFELR